VRERNRKEVEIGVKLSRTNEGKNLIFFIFEGEMENYRGFWLE